MNREDVGKEMIGMGLDKSSDSEIASNENTRVMVIGDDQVSARELVLVLEDAGIKTTMARSINLKKLGGHLPSVVVVEEKAGKSGWEVSSQIRQESDIPIIMLGNSNQEIAWAKAAAYGIDCYMVKPFSSRELVARIRTLVRRYDGTIQGFVGPEGQGMPAPV
jgi:DNA-binding response OmpR family regulator